MATDIPVNGDGTYDEATWAEGGTYGATAYEANGIPDGTILDENTINTPRKHYGRWIRALRDRMYPSDHGLMASCMIKAGTWNVNGGTLDGTLSATWLFIDADDDGGVVVQFSLSAGSPNTFTANSTTYVALNEAGTPAYSVGTPVVTSGYVNVWTVVTDATEITSAAVVAGFPTIPTFKTIGAEGVNVDGTLDVDGDIDVSGSGRVLVVSGGGTTGGSSAAYVSGGIGPAMIVESTSPTDPAVTVTASAATAITGATGGGVSFYGVLGTNSAADGIGVGGLVTTSGTGVIGSSSDGTGVRGIGGGATGPGVVGVGGLAGSGAGVSGTGGATGAGVVGTGGATSGHGVAGTAQGASSDGVRGTGADETTSHGVKGIATNTSAHGVFGTTAAAATTSAAGIRAEALGDGNAVSAVAVSGNAARLESDTSSPSRAPLVLVPQDGDASTTQVGSIAVNSSRNNVIRHHNGSEYRSVHSSAKGHVYAVGDSETDLVTGITSGNSLDLSQATITPEEVGAVEVTVSGWLTWSADGASTTVQLRDDTDDTTINGGGFGIVVYPIFNVTDTARRPNGFHVNVKYTLPDAASRTFEVRLTSAGGDTTYSDVTVTVRGVV